MDTRLSAIDLYRQGKLREAETACEQRVAAGRADAETYEVLAEIHLATGRRASALALLERLTQLRPDNAAALRRLAGVLLLENRFGAAEQALRKAIALEPGSARAHNNLGQALLRLGRAADAIDSHAEALRLDPEYAIGHVNMGLARIAAGDLDRAAEAFDRAIALNGELFQAWAGRGSVHAALNRFPQAIECFDTALRLRSSDAPTLSHKAVALLALEQAQESLACAEAALAVDRHLPEAHIARAGALRRLGRHALAIESLDRAIALKPDFAEAWSNRGMVLHETGDFAAAIAAYRQALQLDPDDVQAHTRLLARLIPSVPLSAAEAHSARTTFDAQLLELETWLQHRTLGLRDSLTVAQQQFFYLSYEEISNRHVLERYRAASVARLAALGHLPAAPAHLPTIYGERASPRLKLGFVSAHVHDHSVFNAILRGWLEHLDHDRFELALFSVGRTRDAMSEAAAACVDHFDSSARSVVDWADAIRDRELDALIYPEIGMNETILGVASLRLARRQFAAWGHPETSGLPTIDGYLSADLFEPPDAQLHYTETLLRLPHLGVHYRPLSIPEAPIELDRWGIAQDRPLLICPGVPFKYRPQDDWILVEIARRLGRCRLVFFEHDVAALSHRLQSRIDAAFRATGLDPSDFLAWIPWQPRAAFFGLLRQADVYLDTIGFSGFNTMMQAIECGLPCVTYEGRFLRGRLGSGILRRLGLTRLIAADKGQYVALAVELASNASQRNEVRAAIRHAAARAYSDMEAVDALADLLLGRGGVRGSV